MEVVKQGLVIRALSSFFYVIIEGEIIECRASKKLKLNKNKIIVGDYVEVDIVSNYIVEVRERKNYLIRPLIANVNNALLVFSITEPKMNYQLLDKMLLVMEASKIKPIIIITKVDLLSITELRNMKSIIQYYEKIGYEVIYSSTSSKTEGINKILKSDKYVITGQTGVGKSTLINKLIPDLNLQTQEISKALNRGKHTTREVTFYQFNNSYLIDTPGFSSLELELSKEVIRDNFIEFRNYDDKCKFGNCLHDKEPKCGVKEAVENGEIWSSRYDNYLHMIHNIKELKWKK